jgi:hypothetical protein
MRQAAMLYIFGFALLMIFLVLLANSLSIVHRVAVVDAIAGSAHVQVHGEGDLIALGVGELVRSGDVVRTGPGSSVELRWTRWSGGMRIKLDENTTFKVMKALVRRPSGEEESRLRVDRGSLWVRLRRALKGKSKFEVETPAAVAAVRGTIFRVTVSDRGDVEVSVWDGTVAVRGGGRDEVAVGKGRAVRIPEDGPPSAIRVLTASEEQDWREQSSIVGPFLAVHSPLNGALCDGASCEVTGRAEPGCEVFVDETPVALSKKGDFSLPIALYEERSTIKVTARTADGAETVVLREVIVPEAGAETIDLLPTAPAAE